MRFGLTGRLLAATLVLALVVSLAFAFLLYDMDRVKAIRNVSRHSVEEVSKVREVRNVLIDLESGQRGFLITADPSFLAPWEAGQRELPEKLAALAAMADDPGQAARAKQIEADILAYIKKYSLPLVDAARRGDGAARSPRSASTANAGCRRCGANWTTTTPPNRS
jgi:CHASE3 domain sensor protein